MSRTDVTAINALTISVNGTPIAGSGTAAGAYTTFDELDADAVLYLNGALIQGSPLAGQVITNYGNVNVLSGVGLANVIKYGSASTPTTNASTGPIVNPASGGTPPVTITLGPLSLSTTLQVGVAVSGTISGTTSGSSLSGSIVGVTINSGARSYSGTPTTAGAATITETLAGASNSPNSTSITVAANVPAAPSLSAVAGNAQVTLSWTDGAANGAAITAHNLYQGSSSGGEGYVGQITSASPYIVTGLTNGTPVYFKITAVNSVGESAKSTEASATPVAPIPLRAIGVQNRIGYGNTTSGGTDVVVEVAHVIGQDATDLVFSFNTIGQDINGEVVPANGYQVLESSVQNVGHSTNAPVTFGGLRTKTLNTGDYDIQSDKVNCSAFGLAKFSRGEIYWHRVHLQLPSATGQIWFDPERGVNDYTGQHAWRFDPTATTASSVDTLATMSTTGTAPSGFGGGLPSPLLLGYPVSDGPSFFAHNDSIADGIGETVGLTSNGPGGIGFFQRSMRDASSSNAGWRPSINLSVPGMSYGSGSPGTLTAKLQRFASYCTQAIDELGTNNLSIGNQTVSQVQTAMQTRWTLLKSLGIQKIIRTHLLCETSSSDSYATAANQTTDDTNSTQPKTQSWGNGGYSTQLNAWLDSNAGQSGYPDYVVNMDTLKDATSKWKWLTNGTANYMVGSDGVHPKPVGHELMAVALRPYTNGAAPVLNTLTTSSTNFTANTAFNTTINGTTSGSTVTASSSDGTALTVSGSGATRTLSGTFTTAGSPTITLTETLSSASNSPKTSTVSVTVAATATLQTLTLTPTTATANAAYSGTIGGKTSGSTVTASSSDGTTLTVSSGVVSGTFTTAGNPTVTLTETLSGATGSPKATQITITVSAASAGATYDPTFNTTGVAYSNGNKTASSSSTNRAVRSTSPKTSGLYYVAMKLTTAGHIVGLTDSTTGTGGGGGTAGIDRVYWQGNLIEYDNAGTGATKGAGHTIADADLIEICVNMNLLQFWMRANQTGNWNNTTGADPTSTNTSTNGGLSCAGISAGAYFYDQLTSSTAVVQCFTTPADFTAQSLTPPSGYTNGWPM